MEPAYLAGDRLLVVPVSRVRTGDVVAVRDPRRPDRLLVKRVLRVDGPAVHVIGDNAAASTDSRHFGPVGSEALVGRVLYRYHPPERSGLIG